MHAGAFRNHDKRGARGKAAQGKPLNELVHEEQFGA